VLGISRSTLWRKLKEEKWFIMRRRCNLQHKWCCKLKP
jgi:hypothetical protein